MRHLQHIALIVLLFTATRGSAQEYSYAHYDVEDGLASSVVYDAAKDHDGFMWFATETGLSRFDGKQFRNYTISDGLPDNEILKLFVDSKNRVWMMPFRSALCFYHNGKIYSNANDPILKTIRINSTVISMAEDRYGNLLIVEAYAFHILRPNGTHISFNNMHGRNLNNIQCGINARGNFIISATLSYVSLCLIELINEQPQIIRYLNYLSPNGTNSVILAPDLQIFRQAQQLWVYRSDSLAIQLPDHFIGVSRLSQNLFAVNSAAGSFIYDLNTRHVIDTLVKSKDVTAAVTDHEGNWWFCTYGQGIFRLISSEFQHFSFSENGKPSPVYSINKFDSTFYFGADKYRVISATGKKVYRNVLHAASTTGRITTFTKLDNETVIVGTDNGLFMYKNSIKVGEVTALSVKSVWIKGDELLTAGHTGVYYVNAHDLKMRDTIWRRRSSAAWKMGNAFYVGTINGLFKVENNITTYLGESDPVFSRRVTALAEGKDGTLWVGTYGEGVVGLKNGKTSLVFSEKNGLSSNNCRSLFINGNDLWVGTEKGLNKVSLTSPQRIIKFTMADGLASNIINTVFVDDKVVYVGTAEGVTRFNEEKISQQSTCVLRMTSITAGEAVWTHDTTNFILPHNNKQLRFEFAGISFKSAGDITYYYRLIGLNPEWQTTRLAFLSYPSLPSGQYKFECYALNKYGIKSNVLTIPFLVEKTIWEKWWFRILAGIALIIAVWAFIVLRLKILRRREQAARRMEQRITELEQMALKAQMNPHFIFNSLNSIQQYVLENDFTGVNNFISGFASLIRQTLEVSSKHKISLEEEVKYISTYLRLEKMRLEDKFTYEINVEEDIIVTDYFIPPLILQPCLENSIRHGIRYRKDKNGRITVNIRKDDTYLIFIIEDNGVGRKLAEQYKGARHIEYQSKGMALTTSRIEMLPSTPEYRPSVDWEDITNGEGEAAGTRVIIRLPLKEVT